jgi:glycerophosphoryl diester phosphodiesterase
VTAVTESPIGPLVFAHRGSSADLPEHTLDAYLRAIDEGADGLECDVRMTRDGHLVCIHDSRVDRTSNGRGRVSAATLDDLQRLDFGSWHRAGGRGATAQVLTLDRLLETAVSAGRPLRLLIETKHPARRGGEVEDRLIETLKKFDLVDEAFGGPSVGVTVMSFSPLAIRRVRQLAPGLDTAFLFEFLPPRVREVRAPFGAGTLGPGLAAVRARPNLVERARQRGHRIYVWTVNHDHDVDFVRELGVDGIISDRPAMVLARLGR